MFLAKFYFKGRNYFIFIFLRLQLLIKYIFSLLVFKLLVFCQGGPEFMKSDFKNNIRIT